MKKIFAFAIFLSFNQAKAQMKSLSAPEMKKVVCSTSNNIVVRDESLTKVLFTAHSGEPINLFQGWGSSNKEAFSDGNLISFHKVQFRDREGNSIGWVAEEFLRTPSDCRESIEEDLRSSAVRPLSFEDPACCVFPLENRPTVDYQSAPASFGARRSKGKRKHAASDLYRAKNDAILSVTDGQVIRELYYFYQGTYALEVKHSGGKVVRYGEINGKKVVKRGQRVEPGQTIGYMGKTSCCTPMLHFELYKGTKSGPLTRKGNIYGRRSDLMDPTNYLLQWQESAFRDRR